MKRTTKPKWMEPELPEPNPNIIGLLLILLVYCLMKFLEGFT